MRVNNKKIVIIFLILTLAWVFVPSLGSRREKEELVKKPAKTSESDKKYREQFESELDSYEI